MSEAVCVKCSMTYESKCPPGQNGGMLCPQCHQAAKDEIAARAALPIGGASCSEAEATRDGPRSSSQIGVPQSNGGKTIPMRGDARWRRYKHE